MDCEPISDPRPKGIASTMITFLRELQSSVQSLFTPFEQQASGHPPAQEVLNFIAYKYF